MDTLTVLLALGLGLSAGLAAFLYQHRVLVQVHPWGSSPGAGAVARLARRRLPGLHDCVDCSPAFLQARAPAKPAARRRGRNVDVRPAPHGPFSRLHVSPPPYARVQPTPAQVWGRSPRDRAQ